MPRVAKYLSAKAVTAIKHTGVGDKSRHPVGGVPGLLLVTYSSGARSWLLRGTYKKRRKDIGLGSANDLSLSEAREKANEYRKLLAAGVDPTFKEDEESSSSMTFAQAASQFCEKELETAKEKERKAWVSTLSTYAIPKLGMLDVDTISTKDIAKVLKPIWREKHELAKKIRVRLDKIFVWLFAKGYRTSVSPAKWVDLKPLLDPLGRGPKVVHRPAVAYTQITNWYAIVDAKLSVSALALKFLCLTAVRSGDVRFLPWKEIDFNNRVWTIPPLRQGTKLKDREHTVPLTERMLAVLEQAKQFGDPDFVFPGPRGAMSENALSKLMKDIHDREVRDGRNGFFDKQSGKRAVPHGLRSTFRDWVAECTEYPGELAEIAIAHKSGSATELAYRRHAQVEKRRPMMVEWGEYLAVDNR